jgi:predicted DNA-binding protein (UPF0251 family)
MSALRSRAGDPLDDGIASKIPDSADNPEMVVEKQNESAVLRQCLTQLSPAHREIIDLVYYHEKSIAEVAEIIGAPPNTVKTRMFHARKRVAALLDAARAVGEFIPRPRPKGCEIMLTYPLASNAARRVNFDEVYSRAFTDSRFGQRVKLLRSDSQFENGKDTGAKQDERVDTGWHSSASA